MNLATKSERGGKDQPSIINSYWPDYLLKKTATLWFIVTAIGLWMFVYYIVALYYKAAIQGNFIGWNQVMAHGYEPGNTIGNIFVGIHVVFAAIITLGGTLQLIPYIRTIAPAFHRWNGRVFILASFLMGISGLYLTLADRIKVGDPDRVAYGIILNAILIILFASIALRYAMIRKFDIHRRWALRLFLVVNGSWFLRIGLMSWLYLTGGIGIDWKSFSGPFFTYWNFGQYLLPLLVLELYFFTQNSESAIRKYSTASVLILLTGITAIGIVRATMIMWLPRILN